MTYFIAKNGVVTLVKKTKPHEDDERNFVELEGDVFAGQLWDGNTLTNPPIIVTAEMVNAEAKHRIHALIGAASDQESNEKQANLQIEYMEYLDIGLSGETLTAEQETRRATIKGGNDYIKAIRAFSNILTAMEPIPTDYADDKWWA